jgi:CxxC motif-containing protein
MTKDFICIVCPESCRLNVEQKDGDMLVEGNRCKRGAAHGINEFTRPMRMLTTTVFVRDGVLPRLPVTADGEVPKDKILECLGVLRKVGVGAPIVMGDVVVENICETGINIVASRSMKKVGD